MQIVIDIDEEEYKDIDESTYPNDHLVGTMIYAVKNGKPLDAVLDEIRAEINSPNRGTCDYFIVDRIEKILDKYKAESEEE